MQLDIQVGTCIKPAHHLLMMMSQGTTRQTFAHSATPPPLAFCAHLSQVGCTPEDSGFKGQPSGSETEAAWCPCRVAWNSNYLDTTFSLVSTTTYSVVGGAPACQHLHASW